VPTTHTVEPYRLQDSDVLTPNDFRQQPYDAGDTEGSTHIMAIGEDSSSYNQSF
jgi:hypothetical protein